MSMVQSLPQSPLWSPLRRPSGRNAERYRPGEVLVKFAGGPKAAEALRVEGAETIEKFADLGWQRVKLPKGMSVDKA